MEAVVRDIDELQASLMSCEVEVSRQVHKLVNQRVMDRDSLISVQCQLRSFQSRLYSIGTKLLGQGDSPCSTINNGDASP